MSKVLMCGDIHAKWPHLNNLINKKKPDIIIQCGDFGFWEGVKTHKTRQDWILGKPMIDLWPPKLNLHGAKLYWAFGNHESIFNLHSKYGRRGNYPLEMKDAPGVYYCPLKSILTLPDGRNVLFMGGAESIDKNSRTIGVDWFPEEVLTYGDTVELPDVKVDIIVSHTCPVEFDMLGSVDTAEEKSKDPSKEALSLLLNYYRPSLWYFGHYHKYKTGFDKGCKWFALNMASLTGWWKWLEK